MLAVAHPILAHDALGNRIHRVVSLAALASVSLIQ